jgi:hypothetical protein
LKAAPEGFAGDDFAFSGNLFQHLSTIDSGSTNPIKKSMRSALWFSLLFLCACIACQKREDYSLPLEKILRGKDDV